MRILVVDDEIDVQGAVARALRSDGHVVSVADDLAAARKQLERGADLLVLDLRLPDGFGLELCRELRSARSRIPVLVLSAMSAVSVRVAGLDAGADDFMGKPFAVSELRARVRALGRRGTLSRELRYTRGDIEVDFSGRVAKKAGQSVPVTSREWSILELLARRPGAVVARADLLESVWGDQSDSSNGSLEVLIARLRRKLGPELIRTLRGEGYALEDGDATSD